MGNSPAQCCQPQTDQSARFKPDPNGIQTFTTDSSSPLSNNAKKDDIKPLWQVEAEQLEAEAKVRLDMAIKKQQEAATRKEEEAAAEAATAAAGTVKSTAEPKEEAKTAKSTSVKKQAKPPRVTTTEKPKVQEAPPAEEPAAPPEDASKMCYDLDVKIASARGLRDADWGPGTSDPYCVAEPTSYPASVKPKVFRTKVAKDKENPAWNQMAKLTVGYGGNLKFTIYDKDVGKEDDLLGHVELPFNDFRVNGFEGELKLLEASDTAQARDAYIKIRVRIGKTYMAD
eukprot:TRINITY_DN96405_c0_g1_i2.p1 TRINITY_DN96405_c0_g1~~TRINITY_DN96405_c0_g1_i2.p1  ORF type:complete len:285 (-),score=91.63 TRINITY_DN96405_c0_g1_i2:205-1059(-)